MSRILVTGAAGFIGSHLCDRFITDGHTVAGLDLLTTGRQQNWPEVTLGDIRDPAAFDSAEGADLIVHCAASYDDRNKWHRDTYTNVAGAINVAIKAREWGARVVYFQTALIYGNNPINNAYERGGSDTPLLPVWQSTEPESSYAISKLAAEQYLRLSGVPLLTLRLANIYGPRNLSGPVPTFYKRITEGQPCTVVDSRRDFVYIDDLVNLVAQAVDAEAVGTYHVSTGRDYAIGRLYDDVVDALDMVGAAPEPTRLERGPDDAPTILLDPSETQRDFGWQARTELDEGVASAVAWYREHGVAETFTHLAVRG